MLKMLLLQNLSITLLLVLAGIAAIAAFRIGRDQFILWKKPLDKMPDTRHLVLPDQRRIAYGIYGALNATPTVFYFHGTPSSHHEAFLLSEAGRRHGVRIVAPSRPGSGGSTLHENSVLLDYPDDILALAEFLQISSFGIIAVSGGAPYAFACRYRIPRPRLRGMGIVAGIYPVASLGTVGMKLPSRLMLRVATWFPGVVAWLIDKQLGSVARDEDGNKLEALLVADMEHHAKPQSERLAWETATPEIRRAVVTSVREGVKYGGWGAAWEMKVLGSHWGFELNQIQPSVQGDLVMWHGNLDGNVPLGMAQKAATQLGPLAELRVVEGQGHVTLTFHSAGEIIKTIRNML
ncbi:hypothetical protein VTI74DRAFT_2248 [Chaetomium olivicolor]